MQDKNLIDVNLTLETKTGFIGYATSVIVARALPNARGGLKPVHRRILYGMSGLGVTPNKPHKKSARVTGDVMGKYHPHDDSSIYEAMVRMAQRWNYRHMFINGHGNFDSMDDDDAATRCYTEARMSKIALEVLRNTNKSTADFQGNYDGSEREPLVLPSRFLNLLVNGATGIAVGMATNIPPHNLRKSIDTIKLVMDDPDVTTRKLMGVLPGPDFLTDALVMGKSGIHKVYEAGKGSIVLHSRTGTEMTKSGRERIVVTEFPYSANKIKVREHIVRLAREKRIEGVTAVCGESNREGIRFIIEVRRNTSANVVLNNLSRLTSLQTNFSFNMLAIENGVLKILPLKQIIVDYIERRKEVIVRRTEFDKAKAEKRAHILGGLLITLDHLDEVISIIRNSKTDVAAQGGLMSRFDLSERQSQAILDMRLRRLTGLEHKRVRAEYDDLLTLIADSTDILTKPEHVVTIIKEEMDDIRRKYVDPCRTELMVEEVLSLEDEDLIEEEDVLITLSNKGYIKRLAQDEFHAQKRGGRGVQDAGVDDNDFVRELVSTSTHDHVYFMTNKDRVYRLRGYETPEYGRTAKGLSVANPLKLDESETVRIIISQSGHDGNESYLLFVTRQGVVKRTRESEFSDIHQNGLKILNLKDGDKLINAIRTNGSDDIIIGTKTGYNVRFNGSAVRSINRSTMGVCDVNLCGGDKVVGASHISDDQEALVITEKSYGKRTLVSEYPTEGYDGKGIKTANITKKSGQLAGLATVNSGKDIMVIIDTGAITRTSVASILQTDRAILDIKIIRLD